MKPHPSSLRSVALLASILTTSIFAPTVSAANAPQDSALQNLTRHGGVSIQHAGPFVAPGTYRVQVSTKFGRPDVVLADGTWMYHHRRVEGSEAEGTLVIRFAQGRVSSLALVTPAVATAMRPASRQSQNGEFVANK